MRTTARTTRPGSRPRGELRGDTILGIAASALPLYLTALATTLASLVDTSALGHHGTLYLAAFTLALSIFGPVVSATSGILRGIMPFAADHRDDPVQLAGITKNANYLAVAVGAVGGLILLCIPLIGEVSGVPEATLARLSWLPVLLALAVLAVCMASSATSVLIGIGQRGHVMRAGLAGTGTAVLLSPTLVLGIGPIPSLGVNGAGIAMVVANAINALVANMSLRRSSHLASSGSGVALVRLRQQLAMVKVGVPIAGGVLIKFIAIGVLGIAAVRISADDAAVQTISFALSNVVFVCATSIGQAIIPAAAASVTSTTDHSSGLTQIARRGISTAVCVVVLFGVIGIIFHGAVPHIFTADSAVVASVSRRMPLILLVVITDAIQVVLGFVLIAIKRTTPSLLAFAASYGILSVVAIPVSVSAGINGLWLVLAAANVILIVVQALALRRFRRLATPMSTPG